MTRTNGKDAARLICTRQVGETLVIEPASDVDHRITGNRAGITFLADERSTRDPQRRQPDISRARTILRWEPKVSLEEGIHKTIPYFKRKLGQA